MFGALKEQHNKRSMSQKSRHHCEISEVDVQMTCCICFFINNNILQQLLNSVIFTTFQFTTFIKHQFIVFLSFGVRKVFFFIKRLFFCVRTALMLFLKVIYMCFIGRQLTLKQKCLIRFVWFTFFNLENVSEVTDH